jgi:hypothetical protein
VKPSVDHIERPVPPWRTPSLTECGLVMADLTKVISRQEYAARLRQMGQTRATMVTCVTCLQTAERWRTWAERPSDVLARDTNQWNRDEVFDLELRALAALVARHPDEFTGLMRGLESAPSLSDRRRGRRRPVRRQLE